MAGFNKTIMFADNVDFTGGDGTVGQVLLDGQLLIGATSPPHIRTSTLTAGTGISVSNGTGTITISATGSGLTWNLLSSNNPTVANNGYFLVSPGGVISLSLPASSALGDVVEIVVRGATGFVLNQAAGQKVYIGANSTTTGVTGTITSTAQGDSLRLVCSVANLEWSVVSSIGSFTIVQDKKWSQQTV